MEQRCSTPPAADPTWTADRGAGRIGSCPAQRDQLRAHRDAGRELGFGRGEPEQATRLSKCLKAILVVDLEGIAGLKWT